MLEVSQSVPEQSGIEFDDIKEFVSQQTEPVIFRGLVADWPLVSAALNSDDSARDYLLGFYTGRPVGFSVGSPELGGRYYYNDDLSAPNCDLYKAPLNAFFDKFWEHKQDDPPPLMYVGSTDIDAYLPGLSKDNVSPVAGKQNTARIWIGNQCRIAAHYDMPDNLACVAAGRRQFTLFPPSEFDNLYVGPLDLTPAGQAISLVDFHVPDFEKFPKFKDALKNAMVADLLPGDAIFIPGMWWHHVESFESFNILMNYWWQLSPAYMGAPNDALLHAIMSIRDLPEQQRQAWAEMFRHYVFESQEGDSAHIPEQGRRIMQAPLDQTQAARIRSYLINTLAK